MVKKILITGASGFLGKIIYQKLIDSFDITSLGRSKNNSVICDLSSSIPEIPRIDYVIHVAGKAHSNPKNSVEAGEFYKVNYEGTINLTKSLENVGVPKSLIFISSVSVYGLDEGENISEVYNLGGESPYAKSKIQAEEYLRNWGANHNVNVTILRLPLVAGTNPPGNLGAFKRAISVGYYFRIGEGNARKSIVWAEDIANFIPNCFNKSGIYNLSDGENPKLRDLDQAIGKSTNSRIKIMHPRLIGLLIWPSKFFDFWPLSKNKVTKLTVSLTFSSTKAVTELGWNPRPVVDNIHEYGI